MIANLYRLWCSPTFSNSKFIQNAANQPISTTAVPIIEDERQSTDLHEHDNVKGSRKRTLTLTLCPLVLSPLCYCCLKVSIRTSWLAKAYDGPSQSLEICRLESRGLSEAFSAALA